MAQQLYARVIDGIVVETWPPAGGATAPGVTTPRQAFGADFGANFTACPSNVLQGWTYDGATFAAPVAPSMTKPQLMAYASGKVSALRNTPRSYDLGGVSVFADATSDTVALVEGLGDWGTANPSATQYWSDDFGASTQINGAQAVTLKASGRAYIQALYAVLGPALAGVSAGTITTTAQIDALAWPI